MIILPPDRRVYLDVYHGYDHLAVRQLRARLIDADTGELLKMANLDDILAFLQEDTTYDYVVCPLRPWY